MKKQKKRGDDMKTDFKFSRLFKYSIGCQHATIKSGRLDGTNDKNAMSVRFVISHRYQVDRKRALGELARFMRDYNKQLSAKNGFIMSIVSTDHSALEDTINIELTTKDYLSKFNTYSSYNMTFDIEGISETDLPYIYGGVNSRSQLYA